MTAFAADGICFDVCYRHRGVICHYDFSEASAAQDHVLPVCRSDYSETSGYNYNIGLTVPYDRLAAH